MVLTKSMQSDTNMQIKPFTLHDTISNKTLNYTEMRSDIATVVMFICNHCPYVLHIQSKIVELAIKFQKQGVKFIAISSNDSSLYPADSPDMMQKHALEYNFCFPYLYDATQQIAKNFGAVCTPEFFILNKSDKIVYHGRFDPASPSNNIPVTGIDLTKAIDSVINNRTVDEQHPSIGCSIKWKV